MKKTALVTGASAGLGLEFAEQLARRGCDLLLVARREERLKEVALELGERHGVEVSLFAADLSDRGTPAALEAFALERAEGTGSEDAGFHFVHDDINTLIAAKSREFAQVSIGRNNDVGKEPPGRRHRVIRQCVAC